LNKNFTFVENKRERNDNMNEVPNMISTKDLSYIADMLNWNYLAVKEACDSSNNISDEEIKKLLKRVSDMHLDHYKKILNLLPKEENNE
jgi:hypothetical protein